ncbi:unnamed protein product [Cylicocyclus nassatus]|uniref:Protein kinase domain-containing protein n=1 Tax=Cylicocyclus nassatus TaxID=53992 RepID=A0AA36M694_CYLNA|nr:unnamed protein product [Cylicocyclus nassatus]
MLFHAPPAVTKCDEGKLSDLTLRTAVKGFIQVKLATHLLIVLKVAIRIINKKAIGDDLPRVATELDALRTLSHQNICRLYQFIETEDKYYIIMEYCSGGEMFDYIVRKERLEESEARHFFRQLVQAMAYVHSMGYAHRDLKPAELTFDGGPPPKGHRLWVMCYGIFALSTSGYTLWLACLCRSQGDSWKGVSRQ